MAGIENNTVNIPDQEPLFVDSHGSEDHGKVITGEIELIKDKAGGVVKIITAEGETNVRDLAPASQADLTHSIKQTY